MMVLAAYPLRVLIVKFDIAIEEVDEYEVPAEQEPKCNCETVNSEYAHCMSMQPHIIFRVYKQYPHSKLKYRNKGCAECEEVH